MAAMKRDRPRGSSIRIYLVDDDPEGFRLVERSNWTGQALVCPRSAYPDARKRAEFSKPGVYCLTGPDQERGGYRLYIGEADDLRVRLDGHAAKDFWTSVTTFVSKDQNLNKAHVKYLESRLCQLAREAGRVSLENVNVPAEPRLAEPDQAEMEEFLQNMLVMFPILGIDAFKQVEVAPGPGEMVFRARTGRLEASGAPKGGGFIVFAGSRARLDEVPSLSIPIRNLRRQLLDNGVLVATEDAYQFVKSYEFSSPSTASSVVLGRSSNGLIDWRSPDGTALKEIQAAAVDG